MKPPIELKKLTVFVAAGTKLFNGDAVEYQGKLWLVPRWNKMSNGTVRPAIMIRFDNLKHQGETMGRDYLINQPIPEAVLGGESTEGFETLLGNKVPTYWPEEKSIQ